MRRFAACVAVLALQQASVMLFAVVMASLATAQPPLTITQSGYYITEVGSDGVPRLVELTTIVDLTGGIAPEPPSDDEPFVDAETVRQVKAWADAIDDPKTAQAIAAVYSHVRGAVDDEIVSSVAAWSVAKNATDSAIDVVDGKDWTPFRDKLSDLVTLGKQRGKLSAKGEIVQLMRSVQQGLELSADGSEALGIDQLVIIAAKTNEAIDGAE